MLRSGLRFVQGPVLGCQTHNKGPKAYRKTLAMPLPAVAQLEFRTWQKVSLVGERAGRHHPDLANYICHQRFPEEE